MRGIEDPRKRRRVPFRREDPHRKRTRSAVRWLKVISRSRPGTGRHCEKHKKRKRRYKREDPRKRRRTRSFESNHAEKEPVTKSNGGKVIGRPSRNVASTFIINLHHHRPSSLTFIINLTLHRNQPSHSSKIYKKQIHLFICVNYSWSGSK